MKFQVIDLQRFWDTQGDVFFGGMTESWRSERANWLIVDMNFDRVSLDDDR